MRTSALGRFAVTASIGVALLSGCGGSQPPVAVPGAIPASNVSSALKSSYKVSTGLLYVVLSDVEAPYDQVNIYDTKRRDPRPLATITDDVSYPQDACMDGDGTLYVTNQGSGNGWISEFPLGKTKASAIITNGVGGPAFCTVDAAGDLWVTNLDPPDVAEYKKGSTSPYTTITRGITYPIGIAIDHLGNMYVVNRDGGSNTNVQVYSPKSKSPARTITNGITFPEGIGVDAKATLYVANYSPGNIEEYRVGQSRPYQQITDDMNGPVAVTFAKDGWFYVTNVGAQGGGSGPPHTILEFPPGSLTPSKKEISKGLYLPVGTAYYPPLLP